MREGKIISRYQGPVAARQWKRGPERCVVLKVSRQDIKRTIIDVRKPGFYGFRGFWYGSDPLNKDSYGKIIEPVGRVMGRVRCKKRWLRHRIID